ncbi:MAG TPA: GNAT family N-acetyltransferase [Gaiellaceae bacterium]|nr:GNAT family N-acetyltransferase [Gaiellaceae bacterium]
MVRVVAPLRPEERALLDGWRYDPPYEFYNGDDEPVLNPERFYVVRDGDEIIGFYYFDARVDTVEIGLGLRPDLTGKGLGLEFFLDGVAFAHARFPGRRVTLNVAAFNTRAITVYERAGFRRTGEHVRTFERWGEVPFVDMEEER